MISDKDFLSLRLVNQQLARQRFHKLKDLISWMGAIQAQDFSMARWAAGIRIPGITEDDVVKAINKGDVLRTHILRPTWHLVASDDIRWMLELTAPNILRSIKSSNKALGLTGSILSKSYSIIGKLLTESDNLSRDIIAAELTRNKIPPGNNRHSHILFCAELEGIICSGKIINNKHTYARFDSRANSRKSVSREEALSRLAGKYFQSHAPASLADFAWWSGLPVRDARAAINLIRDTLSSAHFDSREYFFAGHLLDEGRDGAIILLPAYDEYIISYKDRTRLLGNSDYKKVISINGFFRPVILHEGMIKGTWKRKIEKDKVNIELSFFESSGRISQKKLKDAAGQYGKFLQKEAVINAG